MLGLGLGGFYLLRINPQDQTRLRQIHIKNAALARTAGHPRLLIGGDSTVAFGVDPAVLRETTGLPTVNLGYDAGCGVLALLGVGDRAAQAGDTLVMGLTAELMSSAVEPTREGRLLAMLYGDPSLAIGGQPALYPGGWLQDARTRLSLFSPTERRMINDAGRALLRMPGFRYENCAIDENGYFAGKVFFPFGPYETFPAVNLKWKPALTAFVERLHRRGVRVYYALPWLCCRAERMPALQAGAEHYLRDVETMIPVLREPGYGLQTDATLFADTNAHMNVDGARWRSRSLGEILRAQSARDGSPLSL